MNRLLYVWALLEQALIEIVISTIQIDLVVVKMDSSSDGLTAVDIPVFVG